MSKKQKDPGPWHIVSRSTGKHIGPFTTQLDCLMAQQISTPDWRNGLVLNRAQFDERMISATAAR